MLELLCQKNRKPKTIRKGSNLHLLLLDLSFELHALQQDQIQTNLVEFVKIQQGPQRLLRFKAAMLLLEKIN